MPIDFTRELNPAQCEAVQALEGPVLVIAGAGSGKTRTIVYRLAHLVEQGVQPESILLLTFTRKAAQEMLARASLLLDHGLTGVSGGTFHSFAYAQLRRHAQLFDLKSGFTVMDRADALDVLGQAKDSLGLGRTERSFPKKETILELIGKSRNKETDLESVLQQESFHLMPYLEILGNMAKGYQAIKQRHGLLDYDDLLFVFERLLTEREDVRERLRERFRYIMVDEYQDTNKVQARLVKLMAGLQGNVMAVGDDAQSIYAFRGASVANILRFPKEYPGALVIRLEQNYRSTQPILDLANEVLRHAAHKFDKHLFTEREDGPKPMLVRTLSDATQHQIAMSLIADLQKKYALHEIAVLFRAGYQSYGLEVQLSKLGIRFQKYGGIRFSEAAHIKDALAYLRLVVNPSDLPAWQRVFKHVKGVGPKTAQGLFEAVISGNEAHVAKTRKRFPELTELFGLLDGLRARRPAPLAALDEVMAWYGPILIRDYPDDYPRRQQGLEQLARIAANYPDLEAFLGDLTLENPEDNSREAAHDALVLSTIHSAKGLEWKAVLMLDLVEDRFPSRKAMQRPEDLDEERRLMYVACTRAKDFLALFVPETVYMRGLERSEPTRPSPFVLEMEPSSYEEWRENFSGGLARAGGGAPMGRRQALDQAFGRPSGSVRSAAPEFAAGGDAQANSNGIRNTKLGFCTHRVYGRGKIIAEAAPGKYRINFPGFGIKTILAEYLTLEDA
ncbi:ATP-dependent helicase [Desulfocurvibacter africanus]|uniref:ATP-dependent helicase n=1 Tax=Desulfocurvibacter africanus TaxID=873 RepID=UPI00040D06B7|nr:ATP-dependent helicase [Desulfocurvibacter africanus]